MPVVAHTILVAPVPGVATALTTVPEEPIWDTLVGGAGQFIATWLAVEFLVGGEPISNDPVVYYSVRHGATRASVEEGGAPTGTDQTASLTLTKTGLSAGTWWVSIVAVNSGGKESDPSFAQSVVVS